MSTAPEGTVVCVTGASGYIASWLVKLLLLRGYSVHATLRSLNDPKKTEHLLALEGAKDRLRFFKADLLEDGSFDSAIAGCHGVFHTASPCFIRCNDPQAELIDPAVQGTLNVLRSCAKASSLKRVVLTSSTAAVLHNGKPITQETVVDESWFSDAALCRKNELWYPLAKTLAEEAAWKFAKDKDIDLVVMNPTRVIGPLLQPALNESSATIFNLVGAKTYHNQYGGWVNVKDVANAHIQAFQMESARGRYCLVESVAHHSEIVKILQDSYPTLPLPHECADDKPPIPRWKFSQDKARSLGIDFIPLEISLQETIQSLMDKKYIDAI
ncbi:hypothetical protein V2J09_006806 [Rumex salicifolius]